MFSNETVICLGSVCWQRATVTIHTKMVLASETPDDVTQRLWEKVEF